MKTITSIGIDPVLKQKAKALNINISQLLENTLRGIITSKEENGLDIIEIRKEIDKIEEQITELRIKETQLWGQLAYLEEEKTKEQKEKTRQNERMYESLQASGFLRNKLGE